MKSTYLFIALVGFAFVNTAFLGLYLYSSVAIPGYQFGPAGSETYSITATSTLTETTTTVSTTTESVTSTNTTPSLTTSVTSTGSPPSSYTTSIAAAIANTISGRSVLSLGAAFAFFETHSIALAPGSWVAVCGMWIWRGRMRSRWLDLGFDSDVFGLFVKMKGGKTRLRLLDALSMPKDRLQLAQELGLDWKGVDRHLVLMKKYGFVDDRVAYGKVRMYRLTPMGVSLLRLLQELSREERKEGPSPPPRRESQPATVESLPDATSYSREHADEDAQP